MRAHIPGAYEQKKVLGRVSPSVGTPFGNLGRRSVCRELDKQLKGGSGNGVYLYGSFVRGSLLGTPKVMK
jgi:hypothetical protein